MRAMSEELHASNAAVRNAAFDYLRGFGVWLVLLHHAVLAYVTFGFLNPYTYMQTFSPIAEAVMPLGATWVGFDRIALLNDTFFMPLLFFVSGLFVWKSLRNKGILRFLYARLLRLGIPFLIGLLVIIPIAFYPTVFANNLAYEVPVKGFGAFWLDYVKAGFNPPGPFWFIWLLLAFDLLAAIWYGFLKATGLKSSRTSNPVLDNPLIFAGVLIVLSFASYLPMRIGFAPGQWGGIGPFRIEVVRVLWYLLYFGMGVAVGARGLEKGAFRSDGPFAKYWWAWLLGGLGSYGILTWVFSSSLSQSLGVYVFLIEAALVILALTSVFVRFFKRRIGLFSSFSSNSYGIYLIHYLVIVWLQYAVLRVNWSASAKLLFVFFVGTAICWAFTAAIRRIPLVRRVV